MRQRTNPNEHFLSYKIHFTLEDMILFLAQSIQENQILFIFIPYNFPYDRLESHDLGHIFLHWVLMLSFRGRIGLNNDNRFLYDHSQGRYHGNPKREIDAKKII